MRGDQRDQPVADDHVRAEGRGRVVAIRAAQDRRRRRRSRRSVACSAASAACNAVELGHWALVSCDAAMLANNAAVRAVRRRRRDSPRSVARRDPQRRARRLATSGDVGRAGGAGRPVQGVEVRRVDRPGDLERRPLAAPRRGRSWRRRRPAAPARRSRAVDEGGGVRHDGRLRRNRPFGCLSQAATDRPTSPSSARRVRTPRDCTVPSLPSRTRPLDYGVPHGHALAIPTARAGRAGGRRRGLRPRRGHDQPGRSPQRRAGGRRPRRWRRPRRGRRGLAGGLGRPRRRPTRSATRRTCWR